MVRPGLRYGGADEEMTPVGQFELQRAPELAAIAQEEKKNYVPKGQRFYFNCWVTGNSSLAADAAQQTQPTIARFDATFPQPLVEKADDWSLSVVRFKVPTSYIPLFFYQPNSCIVTIVVMGGAGAGAYSATVNAGGVADPSQPTAVYFVQEFVDAVNTAIASAYAAAILAGAGGTPNFAPFVSYNGSTGLMTIDYEQGRWFPDAAGGFNVPNIFQLFFNFNLYEGYFDSFEGVYNQQPYPANQDVLIVLKQPGPQPAAASPQIVCQAGGLTSDGANPSVLTWTNSPVQHGLSANGSGVNNMVVISGASPNSYNGIYRVLSTPDAYTFTYQTGAQIVATPATGTPTMVALPRGSQIPGQRNSITQETPSVASWDQFVNLRFITQAIPVRDESLPSASSSGAAVLNARKILTDFNPTFSDQIDTRNYIQFFPQGEFRRIDLTNSQPIVRVDITALWVDRSGVEHTVYIPDNETMDIKLLFERVDASV